MERLLSCVERIDGGNADSSLRALLPRSEPRRRPSTRRETYVSVQQGIARPTKGGAERAQQSSRDRQGPLAWADHAARSVQVGPFHCGRIPGVEERAEPAGPQRLWGDSHRHAAQPLVRRAEIHPAHAAARPADADTADPRCRRQCRVPGGFGRTARPAVVLPHRLQRQSGQPAIQKSHHRTRADRRPSAWRGVRASALGRVLPQGRLRLLDGADRTEHEIPPQFPGAESEQCMSFGPGRFARGNAPPMLLKGRYGEPILTRVYNNLPLVREENGGFGRNEIQTHFHNAHNGAESDGAANVHHFPGTFYDYRWSTTLARRDKINTQATDRRASG